MTEETARYDTGNGTGHWAFVRLRKDLKPVIRWVDPGFVLWVHVSIQGFAIAVRRDLIPAPQSRWVKAAIWPRERLRKVGPELARLYVLDELYKNRISGTGSIKTAPKIEAQREGGILNHD